MPCHWHTCPSGLHCWEFDPTLDSWPLEGGPMCCVKCSWPTAHIWPTAHMFCASALSYDDPSLFGTICWSKQLTGFISGFLPDYYYILIIIPGLLYPDFCHQISFTAPLPAITQLPFCRSLPMSGTLSLLGNHPQLVSTLAVCVIIDKHQ